MSLMVCGTGGWNGPKPGDPNTDNLLLTATPAFGGIDLNWTYPAILPEAVAYTIIYRSLNPNPASMVRLVYASGNFFYDRIEVSNNITYYYWIQVVSVNGTQGKVIGPASAIAKPLIGDMITLLTGQIDAGVLAQSLKQSIDRVELNSLKIDQELIDRAAQDDALGVLFNEVEAHSEETRALLQTEVLARTSAQEAFVTAVNTVYATLNGNISAVQQTQLAQVNDLGNLAKSLTNVESSLGSSIAQVSQNLQTNIDSVNGVVGKIGALYTAQVNVNGLIGGFGVYNDGTSVQAGFDVDQFWVGRTKKNGRKPFIVNSDGFVYIDEAAIYSLTFSKLRDESGSFIVKDGKVQAKFIQADQLQVAWAKIQNVDIQTAHIRDANVTTLKIQGNAVTIPVGMVGGGAIPVVRLVMDQPGMVMVMVMANFIAGPGNLGASSCLLQTSVNGMLGPQVGVTAPENYSASAVAFGQYWLEAGTYDCTGLISFQYNTRIIGSTAVNALGIKR